jgi:proline iminopeptidase
MSAYSGVDPLYPPIEPHASGMLDVGSGHQVYWEECGNPSGKPALFLHGGPGGGIQPKVRRLFDPARYRIVLFDQRGCGQSRPHASEPGADLSTNTTWDLVADIERIREYRGIERWQVFGGSWGSTLALAYAEQHPDRVTELVLRGIFTLRRSELDFYYNGAAGQLFPERYETFLEPLGGRSFAGDAISAYHDLLFDPDPDVHIPAGVAWSTWEAATITLEQDLNLIADFSDPTFALAFARIENHYFYHRGWFSEGQLIANADRLAGILGVIIQGRYDVATPAVTAYDLHLAWPTAEFKVAPVAGHAFSEPGILEELVAATDQFALASDLSGRQ